MFDWIIDTSLGSMARTLGSGLLIYAVVVVAARVNGLRTFAKMSGYDFAATVSIGSIIGAVTITKSVPLLEGVVAVAAIVGSQRVLSELRRRTGFGRTVDNPAVLIVANGRVLQSGMTSTGLSHTDLQSTLRMAGVASVDDVTALVFEPTGDLSVTTTPVDELDPELFAEVSGSQHLGLRPL